MNIRHLFKKLLNTMLAPAGLEIRRRGAGARNTMRGALEHVRSLGFQPESIIDVGAAYGTLPLYQTFPSVRHVLIEPLKEFAPRLDRLVAEYPRLEYLTAAATDKPGNITINVHPDLVGTSLYLENEDSNVNGVPREVLAVTLDQLEAERELNGPYLIKLDVQGAELDVLRGGTKVLEKAEYVILEMVLFEFFAGGPTFHDILKFMRQKDFVVYDIFDPHYRPLDGAMSQVDIAFVKDEGFFRKQQYYATGKQREEQNRQFKKSIRI